MAYKQKELETSLAKIKPIIMWSGSVTFFDPCMQKIFLKVNFFVFVKI